jgi:hypothetical protein
MAVASSADGRVVIAWTETRTGPPDPTGYPTTISMRERFPDGTFGPVEVVARPPDFSYDLRIAAGPCGHVALVWRMDGEVHAVVRHGRGMPFAESMLSSSRAEALAVAVAADDRGRTVVAWLEKEGRRRTLASSLARPGSDFGPRGRIDFRRFGSVSDMQLAMSPRGHAFFAWTHNCYRHASRVLGVTGDGNRFTKARVLSGRVPARSYGAHVDDRGRASLLYGELSAPDRDIDRLRLARGSLAAAPRR